MNTTNLNLWETTRKMLARATGLFLLLGSFFLQGQAQASPGPNDTASSGYVQVFSSTEQSQWGEGSNYYLHTGYRIYDSTGKVAKWVSNHDSSTDETPEKVELAPGSYTIWAQSDKSGYVFVPVVVKPYQTAQVHLEGDQKESCPAPAVAASKGKVAGCRA